MKKWIFNIVLTVFMLTVLPSVNVLAENANDKIQVADDGTVTISSDHGAAEGISSLQFGLQVQPAEQNANVSFKFSDSAAKIAEFRYHEDSGLLNIYLAGEEALFDQSGSLSVGTVIVQDQNGKAVQADVSVVKDSLNYVYVTELRKKEAEVPEQPVTINADQPTVPGQPGDTDQPTAPEQPGNADQQTDSDQSEDEDQPENAGQQAASDKPVNPGKSTASNKSGNSGKSTAPDKAVNADQQAVTDKPVNPGQQAASAEPTEPDNGSTSSDQDSDSKSNTAINSKSDNPVSNGEGREAGGTAGTGNDTAILIFAGLLLIVVVGLGVLYVSLRKKK